MVEDRFVRGLQEDSLGLEPPPLDTLAAHLKSRADAACRRLSGLAGTDVDSTCETVP